MGLRGTDFVDKRLTMAKILIGKWRNERGEVKTMRTDLCDIGCQCLYLAFFMRAIRETG